MKRVVPGIHSVKEVIKTRPEAITEIWLKEERLHEDLLEIEQFAIQRKIKIQKMGGKRLDQIVTSHQGVIAYVSDSPSWPDVKRFKESKKALILVCDSIEDPQNMGSLMRSAWNMGVMGVMINKDRSAGSSPSAQKVASGAFEHVPVLEVANLASEIASLKEHGFWVYGLDEKAEKPIYEVSLAAKTILVMGSEEKGMRKPVRDVCDDFIRIPSTPTSSSLNVSVAGGIAIYEAKRQISAK